MTTTSIIVCVLALLLGFILGTFLWAACALAGQVDERMEE